MSKSDEIGSKTGGGSISLAAPRLPTLDKKKKKSRKARSIIDASEVPLTCLVHLQTPDVSAILDLILLVADYGHTSSNWLAFFIYLVYGLF